jgi:outer membrane lipoprotein-sorting protein
MRNLAILLLLTLIGAHGQAQQKPMDAASIALLKSKSAAVARQTQTLSSDFTQVKEMSMLREKIVSGGKFYFKKEKQLRWEYTRPYSYVIVIRDDRITVKDEDKTNSFSIQSSKVFRELNRVILGSIQGTLLSDEKNFAATFTAVPEAWIARLKSLTPGLRESVSEIVIWFDRNDYSVTRLDMIEPGGDKTRITFNGRKLNEPIPDEKFILR